MDTIKLNWMDSISSFLGGFFLAGLGSIKIWFMPIQFQTGSPAADMALEFASKIIGTVMLGTVGGLTGLATKDLYLIIKRKLKKK